MKSKSAKTIKHMNCREEYLWAGAYEKLRKTFKSKLPVCLKRKIFDRCTLPVLTYGAETLTLIKSSATKLKTHNVEWNAQCQG